MDKAQFEALLDRYNLPKEAAWDSLKEGVRFHKMVLDMKTSEEDSLQVWGQDSEELIRLIKAVEGAATIKVLPDNGRGVTIEDKPLPLSGSTLIVAAPSTALIRRISSPACLLCLPLR